jgi:hypothetical protein
LILTLTLILTVLSWGSALMRDAGTMVDAPEIA